MKKIVSVLLICITFTFGLAVSAFADTTDNSFVLTACNANSMIIEPVRIHYNSGETIKTALLNSGYEFAGLQEHGYIEAVEGVSASYVILYDGGGYDINNAASSITAMRIGVTEVSSAAVNNMLTMISAMADYNDMTNNVQNYPDAKTAYKNCLNAIRGNGSTSASLTKTLNNAIASYEALLNGPKYKITVSAYQDGVKMSSPVITFVDKYGNTTVTTGSYINVIAGTYTYSISDGGYNRTEGSMTVSAASSVKVNLPTGEWFGEMYMRSYDWESGYSDPYISNQYAAAHKTVFYVDDSAGGYYGTSLVVHQGGDVPDEKQTKLYTNFVNCDGVDFSSNQRSWAGTGEFGNFLDSLVSTGLEGTTFSIEARYEYETGLTQIQSYEMEVVRFPTLSSIKLTENGTQIPLDFNRRTTSYSAATVFDTVNVAAVPYSSDYTVTGSGNVPVTNNSLNHKIRVMAVNGLSTEYTIAFNKVQSVAVTLEIPEKTTAVVLNSVGSTVAPVNGVYNLVPNQEYTYVSTKSTYYHTKATFVAEDGLTVSVAEPTTKNWLSMFSIYSGRGMGADGIYGWQPLCDDLTFSSSKHKYSVSVSDCSSVAYAQANTSSGTTKIIYDSILDKKHYEITVSQSVNTASTANATALTNLVTRGGLGQNAVVRVENDSEGILYYQEYNFSLNKKLHILEMGLSSDEGNVVLLNNGDVVEFDRDILSYDVSLSRDISSVYLNIEVPKPSNIANNIVYIDEYYVSVNGNKYDDLSNVIIPIDGEADTNTVQLTIGNTDKSSISTVYTLNIDIQDPVAVKISAVPSDMIITMINEQNGNRVFAENGIFKLTPGSKYTYTATCAGYKALQVKGYTAPTSDGTLTINLTKAPANSSLKNLSAQWPHLRLDNNNNGVINSRTPITDEDAVLYWANNIGEGYSSNACGVPILVDGYLYTYAGNKIYKVDRMTGDVVAEGTMWTTSSFAINPPTYANGMIFVGLNDSIQAFNAATLESLWIYKDEIGGQPNSSIVYSDGYIYTGFWQGEDFVANFACINATDENPSSKTETKLASWTYSSRGGFYWAGAYVSDKYVLVGTDDGESGYLTGYASLLAIDKKTGKLISEYKMPVTGDIRSSITCYNGKFYFTSKGGYMFEASVNTSGIIEDVRTLKLYNYSNDTSNPPMSTSTPTIYKGRAYIGVSGTSQFGSYSGHNISVIDIDNWEIAYSVRTQGYPQTSGVLTTAYEAETGSVYVYFFDNYTPGKLRILEDKQGQTEPSLVTREYTYETAYNLFQPVGEHAQFALCSPIVDEYGTIYFKNDSGYLMAVGSAIEKLEVNTNPTKMTYLVGEKFNPRGMTVTAYFKNGLSRDVTKYVTYSEEPLTADDTDFQIQYPYVMYHNSNGKAGVAYTEPVAVISITVNSFCMGDIDGDYDVTLDDAAILFGYVMQTSELDPELDPMLIEIVGDVNGDGYLDLDDFVLIWEYVIGEINEFPVNE